MTKNKNYWNKGLPYLDGIDVLPCAAVFDRTRLGGAVGPGRLHPHHRPGDLAQGQGNAGDVGRPIQSERDPGGMAQFQAQTVRRSAGAARLPPRLRPTGIDRGRQGRDPDAGRRLHLSVLEMGDAETGAVRTGRIRGRHDRRDQGSTRSADRGRPSRRLQGPGFPGARRAELQAVGAGDPGDAAGGARHRLQTAHGRRIGLVRRYPERAFRSGDRRHRLHAARPVGLLQRLVSHRRTAELLVLGRTRNSTR